RQVHLLVYQGEPSRDAVGRLRELTGGNRGNGERGYALCSLCLLLFKSAPDHMPDRFTLAPFEFFVRHTRTRFPFRYGIASMTDVPHLFVRTTVTLAEKSSFGLSSEGLPPKWFTKNPAT